MDFAYRDPSAHCQVCGFQVFPEPRPLTEWDFLAICSCCRTHYGNGDFIFMMEEAGRHFGTTLLNRLDHDHYVSLRMRAWARLRTRWLAAGASFWIAERRPPAWDAQAQLDTLRRG